MIFSSWLENVNDIKIVIEEMRNSGHKLQEIADTLNIPRGTVSDVVVRFKRRGFVENKPHIGRHRLLDERHRGACWASSERP